MYQAMIVGLKVLNVQSIMRLYGDVANSDEAVGRVTREFQKKYPRHAIIISSAVDVTEIILQAGWKKEQKPTNS